MAKGKAAGNGVFRISVCEVDETRRQINRGIISTPIGLKILRLIPRRATRKARSEGEKNTNPPAPPKACLRQATGARNTNIGYNEIVESCKIRRSFNAPSGCIRDLVDTTRSKPPL